jgi:branched-chain amino acid transport system ATP-binding protein
MRAIMSISDTVLVMHEGRELVSGPPERVVEDERVIEAYLGQRYAQRTRGENGGGRATGSGDGDARG